MNLVTKLSERIEVLEDDLKKTKQTYSSAFTKLILRIKKLESIGQTGERRKREGFIVLEKLIVLAGRSYIYGGRVRDKGRIKAKAIMTDLNCKKVQKLWNREDRGLEEAIRLQKQVDEEEKAQIARDEEIARQFLALDEERVTTETKTTKDIDWNDPSVQKYWPILKKIWVFPINNFVPMDLEIDKEKKKPAESQEIEIEQIKKDTTGKRKKSLPRKRTRNVDFLSTKYLIMDWKTYTLSENFIQDVVVLYRLVRGSMDERRVKLWWNQNEYDLISWSLCDFCGVHILLMQNGVAIHMLTEKKYPLSQEMISKMLSKRLEVDHESTQAYELLRFIRSQGRIVGNKSSSRVNTAKVKNRSRLGINTMCDEFANQMTNKFKMSMIGQMSFYLGLQISQSPRGIFINQSIYASEIVKKYALHTTDYVNTPMLENKKLDKDLHGKLVDATLYHGMIGSLMYLTASRPDLNYAVCLCARYQAKPTEKHLQAVKRIFRYINETINMGLCLDEKNVPVTDETSDREKRSSDGLGGDSRLTRRNDSNLLWKSSEISFRFAQEYQMHQPWRTFAALINRGLSGKTSGLDKLRLSRAQILWGMFYQKNVDYVELLWEDFIYQIENRVYKKQEKIFVSAKESTQIYGAILPECLTSPAMKESKAYKTYLGYATGAVPPKMARKFKKASPSKKDNDLVPIDEEPVQKGKRVKRPAKKSTTKPTAGVVIREALVETKSKSKEKEKVDVTHGKGIELLSEVVLTKEAQMKEITPFVTSEGTGDKPGVPDVTEDDSTVTPPKWVATE
ncbi:uncharacterized mitochondrial protein-like protein [Tanacetum coccineum]